jgi:hypothetical protein
MNMDVGIDTPVDVSEDETFEIYHMFTTSDVISGSSDLGLKGRIAIRTISEAVSKLPHH